jgi:hypothetical protein
MELQLVAEVLQPFEGVSEEVVTIVQKMACKKNGLSDYAIRGVELSKAIQVIEKVKRTKWQNIQILNSNLFLKFMIILVSF